MFVISIICIILIAHSQCPIKQIYINSTCQPCYYACISCIGISNLNCTSCQLEYYLSNNSCLACPFNCLVCINSTSCGSCKQGYYLNYNQLCTICPTGSQTCTLSSIGLCTNYYYLSTVGYSHCLPCSDPNCYQCLNASSCELCTTGYLQLNSCLPCNDTNCYTCYVSNYCQVCNNGFSVDQNGQCTIVCPPNCQSCSSTTICTTCMLYYYLYNDLCISGANLLCQINSDVSTCQKCASYAYLSSYSNICVPYNAYNNSMNQLYLSSVNNVSNFNISGQIICNTFTILYNPSPLLVQQILYPSYQINVIYQIFLLDPNNFTTANYSVTDTTNTVNYSLNTSVSYQCNSWYTYSLTSSTNFTVSHTFNSSNSTYKILFTASTSNIGVSQILYQLYLCNISNCQSCTTQYDCLNCIYPFYLEINSCVSSCTSGFYTNSITMQCYSTCPDGFYPFQQEYQCLLCQSPCQNCNSSTLCLTCVQNTFLLNSSCYAVCPSQLYYGNNATGKCQICLYPCKSCQGSGTICVSCIIGYYNAVNNTCTLQCPNSYYGDISTLQCLACVASCATCIISSNICTSCTSTNLYNETCLSTCPAGTVAINNICMSCDSICQTCDGTSTNCTSCKRGYLFNNSCLYSCVNGTYQNVNLCTNCDASCSSCVGPGSQNCTTCQLNYVYWNYSCVISCPAYSFLANNTCVSCSSPCLECSNQTSCNSCTTPLYLFGTTCLFICPAGTYSSNFTCQSCPNFCSVCSYVSGSILCSSCNKGYYLYNQTCNITCPNSTYYDSADNVCGICSQPCLNCVSNPFNCLTCIANYYIIASSSLCVSACPLGYYQTNNSCSSCVAPCSQCSNTTSCTTCIESYSLINNTCVSTCPQGTYTNQINNTCVACISPCIYCLSQTLCLSCDPNSGYPYLSNLVCLSQCPLGSIGSGSTCVSCSINCSTCNNSFNNCTSCVKGYYLYNNSCIQTCVKGYYGSSLLNTCTSCKIICSSCMSYTFCTACSQQLQTYLFGSECLYTCPTGYFPDILTNNLTYLCSLCYSDCYSCSVLYNNCTQCTSTKFMPVGLNYTQTCLSACPNLTYGYNSQCYSCISPCLTCFSQQNCYTCLSTFVLFNHSCLVQCPGSYYQKSNVCSKCDVTYYCNECQNSSSNCTSCVNGYYLYNNSCVSGCPSHYYAYQSNYLMVCLQCSAICLQCSDNSTCLTCDTNSAFTFYQNFTCVSSCSDMYYQSNFSCLPCGYLCVSCINLTVCLKCTMSYLYNNSCLSICPIYTYQSTNLLCLPCISPCLQCLTNEICITCVASYYLYQTYCVSQCPNTTWTDHSKQECVVNCSAGLYYNSATRQCYSNCPHYYTAGWYCVSVCPSNTVINSTLGCQVCASPNCNPVPYFKAVSIIKNGILSIVVVFSKYLDSVSSSANFDVSFQNKIYIDQETTIIGRRLSTNFTVELQNGYEMWLDCQVNSSITTQNITIALSNQQLFSASNYPIQNTISETQIAYFKNYDSKQIRSSQNLFLIGQIFGYLIVVVIVLNCIIDNCKSTVYLTQICQYLYFLNYLQIWYPPTVEYFSTGLRTVAFKFDLNASFNLMLWNSYPKNLLLSTDVNIFRNCLSTFIAMAILLAFWSLCRILIQLCEVRKLKHQFIWSHFNDTFWLFGNNITIFAIFQLQDTTQSFNTLVSVVSIVLFMVSSLALTYTSIRQIYNQSFSQKTFFWALHFENYKNSLSHMIIPLFIIRRFVVVFSTGVFPQQPLYSLFLTIAINLLIISNNWINSPYKRHGAILIAVQLLFTLYIVLQSIYYINIQSISVSQCQIFGWLLTILAILLITILLLVVLYETYHKIKKLAHQKESIQQLNQDKATEKPFEQTKTQQADNKKNTEVEPSIQLKKDGTEQKLVNSDQQNSLNKVNVFVFEESDTDSQQFEQPPQFLLQINKQTNQ